MLRRVEQLLAAGRAECPRALGLRGCALLLVRDDLGEEGLVGGVQRLFERFRVVVTERGRPHVAQFDRALQSERAHSITSTNQFETHVGAKEEHITGVRETHEKWSKASL